MDYYISENSQTDGRRLWLKSYDDDRSDIFSEVEYNVISEPHIGTSYMYFSNNLFVSIDQSLDRELTPNITITVTVRNTAHPPLSSTAVINVHVVDLNDNAPYLINRLLNFTETPDDTNKTFVKIAMLKGFVRDDDDDSENGAITTYTFVSVRNSVGDDFTQAFRQLINEQDSAAHNGFLLGPAPLDRETMGATLNVTIKFTDGGTPSLSVVDYIVIRIIDINDNSPVFKPENASYRFELSENSCCNYSIGSVIAIDADDLDTDNGRVVYLLDHTHGDFEFFTVDSNNGTIQSNETFDREKRDLYTIFISAEDVASPPRRATRTAEVMIVILDENDEPPSFVDDNFEFRIDTRADIGDLVGTVIATDPDLEPFNQISYKFLTPSSFFFINNFNGNIVLTRLLSIQDSPCNLTVVAFNPGFEHLNDTIYISVLIVEANLLPTFMIGVISGSAAFILVITMLIICCFITRYCYKSSTKKVTGDPHFILCNLPGNYVEPVSYTHLTLPTIYSV